MSDFETFFADRLVEERKRLGLDQAEFARWGGVGRTTQVAYENGASSPQAIYLIALSAHEVDVVYILTGKRSLDTTGGLDSEEQALVLDFRAASRAVRAAVRAMLDAVAKPERLREVEASNPEMIMPEPPRLQRQSMHSIEFGEMEQLMVQKAARRRALPKDKSAANKARPKPGGSRDE